MSLVFQGESLLHLGEVSERIRKNFSFTSPIQLLDEVAGCLAKHDRILALIRGVGRALLEHLREARERLVAGTTTGSTRLVNVNDRLVGEDGLEAREDVMHGVHTRELLALDVHHHALELGCCVLAGHCTGNAAGKQLCDGG